MLTGTAWVGVCVTGHLCTAAVEPLSSSSGCTPLLSICWSLWSLLPITGALTAASVSATLQSYLTPEPHQQHTARYERHEWKYQHFFPLSFWMFKMCFQPLGANNSAYLARQKKKKHKTEQDHTEVFMLKKTESELLSYMDYFVKYHNFWVTF